MKQLSVARMRIAHFVACLQERELQCSFVNGKNGHEGEGEPREFVTTRWSLILSAANLGTEEQKLARRSQNFAERIGGPFSCLFARAAIQLKRPRT